MAVRPCGVPELERGRRLSRHMAAALIVLTVSAESLEYFFSRGLSNLYGDGIAHVEGARRLFDSLTPGYAEVGTVWLPLFHLLAAPLALNDFLWRSGLAGSLVSTAAFALAAWALFRLTFEMNRGLASAGVALAGFLLCPSMLYLASTPLTEPLMILWTVVTAYGLFRFQQEGSKRALGAAAVAAFLGTLTRYDGWYLLPFEALFVFWAQPGPLRARLRQAAVFSLLAGAGPVLWLTHNTYRFGNPLEFYNGPFSAQMIYAHQLATTGFRYPTDGSFLLSARYYLADLVLTMGAWPLELAVLGLAVWALDRRERRRRCAALLLLVPFAFYLQSMARASIPLYVPTLFPFTYYNLRYGMEMLPAVSVLSSFLVSAQFPSRARGALACGVLLVLFLNSCLAFSRGAKALPVVREALLNNPCRSTKEKAVVNFMRAHYDGGRILLGLGEWPCLMPETGIPFQETVSEANRKIWPELRTNPRKWVAWIIRGEGDSVDQLMAAYPKGFADYGLLIEGQLSSEGRVEIYRLRAY